MTRARIVAPPKLDDLPMFASDMQIAVAIVGVEKAERWLKERMPTLASKPGFPPIDAFHGGRSVALVRRFYDAYLGIQDSTRSRPDGQEDDSVWRRSRRRA